MGDTRLFLVRVWRDGTLFRASVRRVGDGEPLLFSAPGPLGEFLFRAAPSTAPSAAPRPSNPPRSEP